MVERPILFQGAMVRALLGGTKTQTRRVMARQKKYDFTDYTLFGQRGHADDEAERRGGWAQPWVAIEHAPDWPDGKDDQCTCPYAKARGDQLWVRETFFAWGRWETRFSAKKGRDEWHFVDMTLESGRAYLYAASGEQPQPMGGKRHLGGVTPTWWKRPAIHMPRVASRITLEITGVRVERLQDISKADAIAEGIEADVQPGDPAPLWRNYKTGNTTICPIHSYETLWESINGPGTWDANPWVWVVEFKRVQP